MRPTSQSGESRTMRNLFCDSATLRNEADVEAEFVERLLDHLGYPATAIRRKASISEITLPNTGRKAERYTPDFVAHDAAGRPRLVIEAKHPAESPARYRYQVTGYALAINQRYEDNPLALCIVTNGVTTELLRWDLADPVSTLEFADFNAGSDRLDDLTHLVGYHQVSREEPLRVARPDYHRPSIDETVAAFAAAHQVIWKRDKLGPTRAFYELAKILFVKLRQDQRVHHLLSDGGSPTADDFYFTREWIARQPTDNPISDQLFSEVRQALEREIQSGDKKRIFAPDEIIDLKSTTVVEVVGILESLDLHSIDEDLNGRMFETFLNATVRGRELGQYFTPRGVVKYMTTTAPLAIEGAQAPYVIDACCGSGGFLIEALARLTYLVGQRTDLSTKEKDLLTESIRSTALYGIEANSEIARVARLNMYLHGDGGSRIYLADALDHELATDPGFDAEREQQLGELRTRLVDQNLKFDVALSNPPFSMKYETKVEDERRVLHQYRIAGNRTSKSNVLFLERYHALLRDGGALLTIIDDTVLNGAKGDAYRRFIRENFVIVQVVSLPFNTFFRAQASVKTSILHLRKRRPGEEQGPIFMAVTNNVGHDDHKHDSPHRNNLPLVAELFNEWRRSGIAPSHIEDNSDPTENLGTPLQVFIVEPDALVDHRLDAFYYAPALRQLQADLHSRAGTGEIELRRGADFQMMRGLSTARRAELRGQICRYVEITSMTVDGTVTTMEQAPFEDLPTRAHFELQPNDVLFAKNTSSRGTSLLVPDYLSGALATSGFIGVRPDGDEDALILWSIFRSEVWRTQVYYLAITASQPEIRDDIFEKEMLIPWPATTEHRQRIVESAREMLAAREAERIAGERNRDEVQRVLLE